MLFFYLGCRMLIPVPRMLLYLRYRPIEEYVFMIFFNFYFYSHICLHFYFYFYFAFSTLSMNNANKCFILSLISFPLQQIYDDHQVITSQQHQSILNHQQIVTRLEGTDSEDNDDKYNHNVKRLKYDPEI